MQHLLKASIVLCTFAFASPPATAQEEGPPVPVQKAAYHWPVFQNDYLMVLRVNFPPGKGAGFHTHSLDQISVIVEDTTNIGQLLGEQPTPPRKNERGNVGYTAFSKKSMTHNTRNVGQTPFHNVVVALMPPKSERFTPGARDVPGYTQVLDNDRVRAWKLTLEPGQTSGVIAQKAPGLRIVVDGGEVAEIVPGEPDRGQMLRLGDFYWQEPGTTRAIRNVGTTRIDLVEMELK
jgi:hypothetical protein